MSRFRRYALPISHAADWSAVSETTDDHGMTYKVLWSAESWMYLGLCESYPTLSWQAATESEAFNGIRRQVQQRANLAPRATTDQPEPEGPGGGR